MRKPWYRSRTNSWVVQIGGKQHSLGVDPRFRGKPPKVKPKEPPAEVVERFHSLMRATAEPDDRTFEEAVAKYIPHLDTSEENRSATRLHLRWFGDFVPEGISNRLAKTRVAKIRKHMLTEFLATKQHWKPNTKRFAITRILACLNFCEREQYIVANPLKGYERPRAERREKIITDEEFDRLTTAAMPEFRDLLVCMRELGTRPGELYSAQIGQCDLDRGVLLVKNKLAAQGGEKFRPVFLTDRAREVLRGRIDTREQGFIFLNRRGSAWDRHTGQQYMRRLRAKLGLGESCTLYAIRHLWTSYAINQANVNPALVALQAGWTDLRRLMKTYLHDDLETMRKAVEQAAKK